MIFFDDYDVILSQIFTSFSFSIDEFIIKSLIHHHNITIILS
jgi:hypothetical protein